VNNYKKNLEVFKSIAVTIYSELKSGTPLFPVAAKRVAAGNIQIEHDGGKCLLHSCYSIKQEMESMFANISQDAEILVVFGFGGGHFLPYIASRFKNVKQIVIIEPSLQLFDMVLHECDLNKLVKMPRQTKLSFVVNKPAATAGLWTFQAVRFQAKVEFVAHLTYRGIFSDYYQNYCNFMADWFRLQRLEFATIKSSMQVWLHNTVKNIAIPAYHCEVLQDLFRGKPAILVSAGPSLEKHIHLLADAQHKAVIVAVGTAIKVLDKAGVRPHFYAAMDAGSEEKTNIFDQLATTDIPLLFANQLQSDITANYPGPRIRIVKSDEYLARYVCELADQPLNIVDGGPSIANMILHFLCAMQCSTVIFIGQDMCFKDDKIHATGGEKIQDEYEQQLMTVQDILGQEVKTLPNYFVIKGGLEASIIQNPAIKFINATEGGLGITGAGNRRLADVLAELTPLDQPFTAELSRIMAMPGHACKEYSHYFEHEKLLTGISTTRNIAEQSLEKAQAIAALIKAKADRSHIDKEIELLKKYESDLQNSQFYKRVAAPALAIVLETFTNMYQGKVTAVNWDTRIEAIIGERVAKSIEIRYYCDLVIQELTQIPEKSSRIFAH